MTPATTANRIIVLDTETTGLSTQEGHRIIEIGCVELINRRLTGRHFHHYINPNRAIDEGALAVHGITSEFLQDKPHFAHIADEFITFIRGAELVIHNAPFDVGFLNYEFSKLPDIGKISDYSSVFDTLTYARKKHPGQRNTLDALCRRYNIDNSHRELHGALLDAEILADVFLLMTGGQFSLLEATTPQADKANAQVITKHSLANRPALKIIPCNDTEQHHHQQRLAAIEKASGNCLWHKFNK